MYTATELTPPVHFIDVGIVTVMLKFADCAWEKPLAPGTLSVTDKFCEMIPAFPVSSRSQLKYDQLYLSNELNVR